MDKIMPKHVAYHRDLFMGSARVNRRLDWLQRHIYRQLCLEACFCETRPYLPADDAELALLADVPDDVWQKNSSAVLAMFTKSGDGYTHPRILMEWERVSTAYEQRRDAAKRGGAANAKRVEESRSAPARLPNASHHDPYHDPYHDPNHDHKTIERNDEAQGQLQESLADESPALGFDPLTISVDGYTQDQVRTVVEFHWNYSKNGWWREHTNTEAYFKRNFAKMAAQVPKGWSRAKAEAAAKAETLGKRPIQLSCEYNKEKLW